MELTVQQAFNASAELARSSSYPTIRLFTVGQEYADTSRGPYRQLRSVWQDWAGKMVILSRFVAVRLANPKKYHHFSCLAPIPRRRQLDGVQRGLLVLRPCAAGAPPSPSGSRLEQLGWHLDRSVDVA